MGNGRRAAREGWSMGGRAGDYGLDDAALVARCRIEYMRASGPGGRRRDTTETAVRITHLPSGAAAVASERRSREENLRTAMRRLRKKLAISLREPLPPDPPPPGAMDAMTVASERNPLRLEAFALALDALEFFNGRMSEAASWLGISTGRLSALLASDPDLWQEANRIRQRHGLSVLRQRT
ncbi:MAG: peptide chain release factor-like protein [Planctomycetota bacterium]|nr:peptide chain release factor-like protein [Planctomycetota bacterium]